MNRHRKRDCEGASTSPRILQISLITSINAQALLNRNAKVYFAGRSKQKNEEAIKQLKDETGREGIFLELDLADLKSVKKAAEEFRRYALGNLSCLSNML